MWNRNKWDQFISDYTKTIPTDESSKKAAAEAKELVKNHYEDVDLAALGIQRAKEYLEYISLSIHGSPGIEGLPGIANENSPILLTSIKRMFPSGHHTPISLIHRLNANELDGDKDLLYLTLFQYGASIKITIDLLSGPPTRTLYIAAGPNISNGFIDIWIGQCITEVNSSRSVGRSVGSSTYGNTSLVEDNWMVIGGDITITISPKDPMQPWGGNVALYKLSFPKVTIE